MRKKILNLRELFVGNKRINSEHSPVNYSNAGYGAYKDTLKAHGTNHSKFISNLKTGDIVAVNVKTIDEYKQLANDVHSLATRARQRARKENLESQNMLLECNLYHDTLTAYIERVK